MILIDFNWLNNRFFLKSGAKLQQDSATSQQGVEGNALFYTFF